MTHRKALRDAAENLTPTSRARFRKWLKNQPKRTLSDDTADAGWTLLHELVGADAREAQASRDELATAEAAEAALVIDGLRARALGATAGALRSAAAKAPGWWKGIRNPFLVGVLFAGLVPVVRSLTGGAADVAANVRRIRGNTP